MEVLKQSANEEGLLKRLSPGYVFVDIDEKSCAAFQAKASVCKAGNPISATLVAAIIESSKKSGALVVILDVAPFEDPGDRETIRRSAVSNKGPWIIAPISGRPYGDDGSMRSDRSLDLSSSGAEGRLRLASFKAGFDKNAMDGLLRTYSPLTRSTDTNGENLRTIPSAPYLASILIDEKRRVSSDCSYYGVGCKKNLSMGDIEKILPAFSANESEIDSLIPYSLPSLSSLRASGSSKDIKKETYFLSIGYLRIESRKILDFEKREFDFGKLLQDKIVVIGSSMPSALGMQLTPIGSMSGSEIILNATHGFIEQARRNKSPHTVLPEAWGELLIAKGEAALKGSLLMLFAWYLIFFLVDHAKTRAVTHALFFRAGAVAVFFFALAIAMYWEVHHLSKSLTGDEALLRPVDVLTPILIVGMAGFAEGAKIFLIFLERSMLFVFKLASGSIFPRKNGEA